MKVKSIAILTIILAGFFVFMFFVSSKVSVSNEYKGYVEKARKQAEREIPYMAMSNFGSAIKIKPEDEAVYVEYLEQCKLLGDDFYEPALTQYIEYFPQSAAAYDRLCEYYYEDENYKYVITTALAARTAGVASERVKELYYECAYMYNYIKAGFSEASSFLSGIARVKDKEGKVGYLTSSGSFLISPIYVDGSFFLESFTAVNDGVEWHMINRGGYKVARTSEPVDSLTFLNDNRALASKGGKYAYLESDLVVPEEFTYEDATVFKTGIAAVKKDGKWAIISSDGKTVTDFIFDDIIRDEYNSCISNGIIFAQQEGKYYMYNSEGKRVADTAFDNARLFISEQPAAVCVGEKWGFVDLKGNIVIEPQYDDARSFSIGVAPVSNAGMWGYISESNEIRIEFLFEDALSFSKDGATAVCENGMWNYIKLLSYLIDG